MVSEIELVNYDTINSPFVIIRNFDSASYNNEEIYYTRAVSSTMGTDCCVALARTETGNIY